MSTTIWDVPNPDETETSQTSPTTGGSVPIADQPGPVLNQQGYGVVGGVPYGETERDRHQSLRDMYPFQPGWVARLRGATRSALGR